MILTDADDRKRTSTEVNPPSYAPAKDFVEVVRCKDCLWRHDSLNCNMYSEGMDPPGNWYCADGYNKYYKDDPSHPFADDVMMGERKDV